MDNWHVTGAGIVAFGGFLFALERIYRILLKPLINDKIQTKKWRDKQELRNKYYDRALPDEEREKLLDDMEILDD